MIADIRQGSLFDETVLSMGGEDPLSGLIGSDGFAARVRSVLGLHLRTASALTLIEIDHFDSIVSRFGEDCGDMVIRGVGQHLLMAVRGNDVVGRLNGASFAVLHCEIDYPAVRAVGERLRKTVQDMEFFGEDGRAIPVTVSVGIEVIDRPGRPRTPSLEACMVRATDRLSEARSAGCNRVVAPAQNAA